MLTSVFIFFEIVNQYLFSVNLSPRYLASAVDKETSSAYDHVTVSRDT